MVPQGHRVAEPAPLGDGVDGLVGLLEQLLGEQDPLPGQPALRGGAGVLDELPGERAFRHVRPGGQLAHGERLAQVGLQPFQQVAQRAVAGRGDRPGHMHTDTLLGRLAGVLREMNDAMRRMTELRLNRGLGFGDEAPATYAEFLLRTSASSVREPAAVRRPDRRVR
jgi:hypothetical protein